jgi:hypothetical protein
VYSLEFFWTCFLPIRILVYTDVIFYIFVFAVEATSRDAWF